MGLNIGISVKRQQEGYMQHGCNPKGDVSPKFDAFLREKFPKFAYPQGGGFGNCEVVRDGGGYGFNVRMARYGSEFGKHYEFNDMYLAIFEFILDNFSVVDGIKMHAWYSG